jgi:hypothetical protein
MNKQIVLIAFQSSRLRKWRGHFEAFEEEDFFFRAFEDEELMAEHIALAVHRKPMAAQLYVVVGRFEDLVGLTNNGQASSAQYPYDTNGKLRVDRCIAVYSDVDYDGEDWEQQKEAAEHNAALYDRLVTRVTERVAELGRLKEEAEKKAADLARAKSEAEELAHYERMKKKYGG